MKLSQSGKSYPVGSTDIGEANMFTVVRVRLEDLPGHGLRASSQDLAGLILSIRDVDRAPEIIAGSIKAIFELKLGKNVQVVPARDVREVLLEPSPRTVSMRIHQQDFVVELENAA